jgi:glutamyl-tRNA synthetase
MGNRLKNVFACLSSSSSSACGALFDVQKLSSISKDHIARLSIDDLYIQGLTWAERYAPRLAKEMATQPLYTKRALGIWRIPGHIRKDISRWSDLESEIGYFFDAIFETIRKNIPPLLASSEFTIAQPMIEQISSVFDDAITRDEWQARFRTVLIQYGFAPSTREFKEDPRRYKGHMGDVAMVLRILLTGRKQTPDLFDIMHILGKSRVAARLIESSELAPGIQL